MSKQKIILIVLLVALVAVTIWYVFFKKESEIVPTVVEVPGTSGTKSTVTSSTMGSPVPINSTVNNNPPVTPVVTGNDNYPLIIGSSGERVKLLQNALKRIKPSLTLPSNGVFDAATRLAVITFVGTSYYPVTANNYGAIMTKSMNT